MPEPLRVPLSILQPEALDAYGSISVDLLRLAERLKSLPAEQRRMLTDMFQAQIDSFSKHITPT